ncbi:hypothetical protein SAMN06296020_10953 [Anoxynatronum buryatiense]|uniref:Uncharacterized protein n=1 Tax=Anoxynatronum buryatiense TaxID=489973 RepID=A0AA46AJL8_9CLOT|nr:hypothetical protein SAMN06296020_10953 [Anoxynatronum buryatiense]
MVSKLKRAFIYLIILAIPSTGLLYTIPRSIERELPAVEYRLGRPEEMTSYQLRIEGVIQRRLFDHKRFRGTIWLNDRALTDLDFLLRESGELLMARDPESGQRDQFGAIYVDESMSRVTIAVLEPVRMFGIESSEKFWNQETGKMISAPADSRKDALRLSNEIMEDILEKPLE